MKKISLITLSTLLFVVMSFANYPPSSYELNSNGQVLMKWTGSESKIDMNSDPVLKKVLRIHRQAFQKNTSLESIVIGENVKVIGSAAFNQCSNLKEVVLPPHLTEIPSRAFRSTAITSIKMPNTITEIGPYAFWGCRSLKKVVFSNSLEKIGAGAFRIAQIEHLNLPETLTFIDNGAFHGMRNLQTLTIYAKVPPTFGNHTDGNLKTEKEVFEYVNFRGAKLLVPRESVQLYKEADQWNQFKNIEAL